MLSGGGIQRVLEDEGIRELDQVPLHGPDRLVARLRVVVIAVQIQPLAAGAEIFITPFLFHKKQCF